MAQRRIERALRRGFDRHQGRAHDILDAAELRERIFRAAKAGFEEDRLVQGEQTVLKLQRRRVVLRAASAARRSKRPSNLINSLTAASTDASLVTSSANIANERWPDRAPRLLVP